MSESSRAAAASLKQTAQDAKTRLQEAGQELLQAPEVTALINLILNAEALPEVARSSVSSGVTLDTAGRGMCSTQCHTSKASRPEISLVCRILGA